MVTEVDADEIFRETSESAIGALLPAWPSTLCDGAYYALTCIVLNVALIPPTAGDTNPYFLSYVRMDCLCVPFPAYWPLATGAQLLTIALLESATPSKQSSARLFSPEIPPPACAHCKPVDTSIFVHTVPCSLSRVHTRIRNVQLYALLSALPIEAFERQSAADQ